MKPTHLSPHACGTRKSLALLGLLSLLTTVVSPQSAQTVFMPEGNPAVSMDTLLSGARGIAVDANGRVFVADTQNHVVRMFMPDGTPATVFGRIGKSGRADGVPAQVRFNLPFRLALDQTGGLLVLDSRALVRRLDPATLTVQTVADLSVNVDGSAAYDVATGGIVDRGTLSSLQLGDLAVHPDGRVFITAADSLGLMQYLLLLTPPTARVVATSKFAVQQSSRSGPRGVAIDASGNLFMPFPIVMVAGGEPRDIIFRFPNSGCQGVTQHLTPLGLPRVMAAGRGDRVYFATTAEDLIYSFSATTPDQTLGSLAVRATFPGIALQQVREITVGLRGELLAVNERQLDSSGIPTSPFSKVDCFEGEDLPQAPPEARTAIPARTMNPGVTC